MSFSRVLVVHTDSYNNNSLIIFRDVERFSDEPSVHGGAALAGDVDVQQLLLRSQLELEVCVRTRTAATWWWKQRGNGSVCDKKFV